MATPTLTEIITEQAKFTSASGYTVKADRSHDTVAITHSLFDELDVFLQDEAAADFIYKAWQDWITCGDLSEEICQLAQAKQYIESL